ncbi:hypothetical protein DPMN_075383 [Dreissena polymorpha]|uniref:Uncharacterized protein n=1 Tax=Dreissena polymorpha TaxID=45954 RepID=A0A9D3YH34_DREPO|nr:hypothetical protein DPMN_075383 [Dreissena polymorpha]
MVLLPGTSVSQRGTSWWAAAYAHVRLTAHGLDSLPAVLLYDVGCCFLSPMAML